MNKEELIGKLQMVYVGDKNALNELIGYYDGLKEVVELLKKENQKYKEVIDKLKNQPTVYLTKYLSDLGFVETKTLNELIEELENDILKEVE